jgi:hypothetical protein
VSGVRGHHAAVPGAGPGQNPAAFGVGSRRVYLDRAVYTTITVLSSHRLRRLAAPEVLGCRRGDPRPSARHVVSHVFSDFLARQAELHERPGLTERMRIIRTETRFLLLAVPALALLIILTAAGVSLDSSIQVIIFVEGASLGFWAFLAGRRAGLTGWPLARTVALGLIVGLVVLVLQVVLQPGHASLVERR